MKILPLSEVKMKLSRLVDDVKNMDQEITITKNGRPVAIMISPDEYEGWKETIEIMSNKEFMKDIRKGIKDLREKKSKAYTLEEFFNDDL